MNAVAVDRDTREAVEAFMFREAELLDGGQFREWLGLLDPDIRYVVPVRTTREDSAGWVGAIAHWNDDYTGLEMRVAYQLPGNLELVDLTAIRDINGRHGGLIIGILRWLHSHDSFGHHATFPAPTHRGRSGR
nr:aromatic-ring-hydroxylating dioxygenase subunit beta [Mycolicibacterium monacense]